MHGNLKILVVDDEDIIRHVVKEYLDLTNNYTVMTAKDGLEAFEIVKREGIDCCLTDLSMPGLDGVGLTEKIHQHDNTIPVIVMTGYPSLENAIKTLKNGVVDFLTKPIKMEQLPLIIERVMRERALFVENTLLKEENERNERLLDINRELHQKIREVESINLIFHQLDQASTSKELFNILVNLSGEITSSDEAHFCLSGRDLNGPVIIASFSKEKSRSLLDTQYLEKCIINKVSGDGLPLLMREGDRGVSIMAIPVKIRSSFFGTLITVLGEGQRDFNEKDLYLLNFLAVKASSLIENMALYENIYENLFSTLYAFVEAIEAKDPYTKQHSARVTSYAIAIAKDLGCSEEEIDMLNVSGNLHDIGKIGIPDNILLKPGSLTDLEYSVIKKHPTIGSNIIGHHAMWAYEKEIIKHHHERWDGKGYPDGLVGEKIPFFSRILSVADTFDALTSDRSYREKASESLAIGIIKENAGGQFDPEIAAVFLNLQGVGGLVGQ